MAEMRDRWSQPIRSPDTGDGSGINSLPEASDTGGVSQKLKRDVQQFCKYHSTHPNEIVAFISSYAPTIPTQLRQNPEIQSYVAHFAAAAIQTGWMDSAKDLIAKFGIRKEFLYEPVAKIVAEKLDYGKWDRCQELIKTFELPAHLVESSVEKEVIKWIGFGQYGTAIDLISKFNVPVEKVSSAEVARALVNSISSHKPPILYAHAEMLRAKFLPEESLTSVIFNYREGIKTFFDKLGIKPNDQLAVQLCEFAPVETEYLGTIQTIVQSSPFLLSALEENPKYGVKLLLKYPELDELSQNNIRLLYEVKGSYKGSDTDATEFRVAVQERLIGRSAPEFDDQTLIALREKHKGFVNLEDLKSNLGYKQGQGYINNPAILAAIETGGVDVGTWLNYSDEREFDLGKEEDVSFSKKISVPFDRFIASIDRHDAGFKSAMGEYKNALRGKRVALNQNALVEEIAKLRSEKEKPEYAGDDPEARRKAKLKAEGIPRRLAQLEAQLTTPQTVSLWDKFTGDLSVIQQNKKAVQKIHENMRAAEEAFKTLSSGSLTPSERRKKMIEYKNTLSILERDLVEKVVQVNSRLTTYDQTNMALLSTHLGQESGGAFQQEFLSRVSVDMDHLGADAESIGRMIQIENENISLVGTSMRIGVWNRDPDVDLYLGNETDCCIRIDSVHMGEESTIADYLTDVGVQVVKMTDEKRNSTVVAAWCFVGKNRATGEVALVVDNIEANTDYSSQFNTQLSQELRTYLETYAHKSGFTKIVQGESNNDLELFEMDGEYDKLGGYNREGGYYLEGEADDGEEDE